MLNALPLSGLSALDDGLAEKGAHLLDPETNGNSKRQPTHVFARQQTNGKSCVADMRGYPNVETHTHIY